MYRFFSPEKFPCLSFLGRWPRLARCAPLALRIGRFVEIPSMRETGSGRFPWGMTEAKVAKAKATAGPSAALRFAQGDERCGFWEERKSKSKDSRGFVVPP